MTNRMNLTDKERDRLLAQWNNTETEFPASRCVHQLFEEQVERTPDAVAVVIGAQKFTYAELNSHANKVAHFLVDQDVRPGAFVGICAARSLEMVTAILGVLKAGAAYIPLDPEYPQDRLTYMLENSRAPVLLTQKRLNKDFSSPDRQVIYLDDNWAEIDSCSEVNPATGVTPDNHLYVIYTSGSTGQPKGTLVHHRGFVNLVSWYAKEFDFNEESHSLLVSSTGFDLTQKNIYAPLITGGILVLLDSQIYDAGIILNTAEEKRITHINCTPSAFYGLVDNASQPTYQSLSSIRYAFLGGEPIAVPRLRPWLDNPLCRATVVNTYGPTECTDVVAFHRLDNLDDYETDLVPIGRPIANTQLYILDEELNPVPVGAEGELCIGGVCVGGGYLGLPDLTSERFVDNRFSAEQGARFYRSGDRARYRENGVIEFLGRIDNQVKIRGFRIELGEIESALSAHPDIHESVVLARDDEPGDKRLVAYMVLSPGQAPAVSELRRSLQETLPDYMLPNGWVFLDKLPLTPNGKVDRLALPAPELKRPELAQRYLPPKTDLEKFIAGLWCEILSLDRVGTRDPFFELGGSSIKSIQFLGSLGSQLGITIPVVSFFEEPTVTGICAVLAGDFADAVAAHFGVQQDDQKTPSAANQSRSLPTDPSEKTPASEEIAIIGIAGRFPGAENTETFWENLRDGVESMVEVTADNLRESGLDPALLDQSDYVNTCVPLDGVEDFDADFFGFSPREIEIMDPQHRLFLEGAWSALENAGYPPDQLEVPVGVFGGVARDGYLINNILSHDRLRRDAGEYHTLLGNEKDYPATRVAYKLNLKGPAVNVQTACSSSGVAINLACQSLLSGESQIALAGGSRVIVPNRAGYHYVDGGTLSADGHVRAFDAKASGMVRGSGVAMLVLKPLATALNDGDHIHGIIKSVAVNNDGAEKIGFTAPSSKGQSAVVSKALNKAGLSAEAISYVEAHGTGTNIGDPIEVAALTRAYRESTDKKAFCAIGSVKTNIGHLDAGACAAGVIKTLLAFEHEMLPPTLNFDEPNPQIDFINSPFKVNATLTPWPRGPQPRRAGVSSFGLGGTNVHIILEEGPVVSNSSPGRPAQLITLSAKTTDSLDRQRHQLGKHLAANPGISLADVENTLIRGRSPFDHRSILVSSNVADAADALETGNKTRLISGQIPEQEPGVVFMFTGQGAQYVGMGRELYASESTYQEIIDYCADYLQPVLGLDLRTILYANDELELASARINQTDITQPALFVTEYALAKLWMEWGVTPDAMIGHSIGEYVAACLAGVFSLDDALSIVAERARLMQAQPPGKMLAIRIEEDRLAEIMPDQVCLAACNTPGLCVVSADTDTIDSFAVELEKQALETIPLVTSHAFHSHMMDPMLKAFADEVGNRSRSTPEIPFISVKTGDWITDDQATDPQYWADQLRNTVRFSDGIQQLQSSGDYLFLEIGPGNTLTNATLQQNRGDKATPAIASLPHAKQTRSALETVLEALGRLWVSGIVPDWNGFYQQQNLRRVPLPTYPFDRKRHWIDPLQSDSTTLPAAIQQPVVAQIPVAVSGQATDGPAAPASTRKERILVKLRTLMQELSGIDFEPEQDGETFLALGLDSLFLTQVSAKLGHEFGVTVKFRQLLEELTSLDLLSDFLDDELPADALPAEQPVSAALPPLQTLPDGVGAGSPGSTSLMQQVIGEQLTLMARQLDMLQAAGGGTLADQLGQSIANLKQTNGLAQETAKTVAVNSLDSEQGQQSQPRKPAPSFGAAARIDTANTRLFSPQQQVFFDQFLIRYTGKTAGSKQYTADNRPHLADPRAVSGFNPVFKELVYPIVVKRSSGSRVWDIDDNEYLDMTNGFGANLLGHSPPYITEAVKAQLDQGIEIGPQHPLAGEVARLITEFTGQERVIYCNTGSEAVLGAMRMARTVTGKDKIVIFTGDYHGMFDEVIVRGSRNLRSIAAAPGIPAASVENMIVLEYGSDEALETIRDLAGDIAAVLIEPVQSRNLDLQPKEFLHQVRQITADANIAMVMDEVITGFRLAPGGAQAYFGVKADIATYGKVVGGGMPIGVIAGNHRYMDALDGGHWSYGDDSIPEVGVTYFAGTFVRHPLALAAARATLLHLRESGPQLQQKLNDDTARCVAILKQHFREVGAPIKVLSFSSAFQVAFTEKVAFGGLMFPLLRDKGIHIAEGRTWFFTTAHSESDYQRVIDAFKQTVAELQEAGFLPRLNDSRRVTEDEKSPAKSSITDQDRTAPKTFSADAPPVEGARLGRTPDGTPAWFVPDPNRPGKYCQLGNPGNEST